MTEKKEYGGQRVKRLEDDSRYAWQFKATGKTDNFIVLRDVKKWPNWILNMGSLYASQMGDDGEMGLRIVTPHGYLEVESGDWIIFRPADGFAEHDVEVLSDVAYRKLYKPVYGEEAVGFGPVIS